MKLFYNRTSVLLCCAFAILISEAATAYCASSGSPLSLNSARQAAVRKAWQQERVLVMKTGRGTRDWSPSELQEIKETGRVKGVDGHHRKSVSKYPEHAGNPDNIKFVKGKKEHLKEHGGSFKNPTKGSPIKREKMLENYSWGRSGLNAAIGALQFAGGVSLVWNYLPDTLEQYDYYTRGGKTDTQVLLQAVGSGLYTGAGAASTVAGAAKVASYVIAKNQAKNMHRILGPLRATSKTAGIVTVILIVSEQGVYAYRWNQGYISTPDFIKRVSIAGGALAGAAVGSKLGYMATKESGEVWVKAGGQLVGATVGAVTGAWGVAKAADNYYASINREKEEVYLDHLYEHYGQKRIWTNEKLYGKAQIEKSKTH